MATEEDIAQVRKKLARAVNAVHAVSKDSTANLGEKIGDVKFASIGTVLRHIKAELQHEGLSLMQPFGYISEGDGLPIMTVDTLITDTSTGHYIGFTGPGFPVKADPQAAAGAVTYFRRVGLVSLFGLIVEDDDAVQSTQMHRNPTERTEEEVAIRKMIGDLPADQQSQLMTDFKAEFNSTLTNLDSNRHQDAAAFVRSWRPPVTEEAAPTLEGTQ